MPEQASILAAIQEMVSAGQNEQQILANLRELGVAPDQAQKLLVLAQADIYTVLQTEINKSVEQKFEEKKPEMIHHLQDELQLAEESAGKNVQEKTMAEMKEYQKYSENRWALFQSQTNENLRKALETADNVREKVLIDEQRIHKLELDGPGSGEAQSIQHSNANTILIGIGVLFAIATIGVFYFFSGGFSIITTESLIIGVVLAMITVAILFAATLV